jgi:hypothetical protein
LSDGCGGAHALHWHTPRASSSTGANGTCTVRRSDGLRGSTQRRAYTHASDCRSRSISKRNAINTGTGTGADSTARAGAVSARAWNGPHRNASFIAPMRRRNMHAPHPTPHPHAHCTRHSGHTEADGTTQALSTRIRSRAGGGGGTAHRHASSARARHSGSGKAELEVLEGGRVQGRWSRQPK